MEPAQRSHLEIPSKRIFLDPALEFIQSYAAHLGIQQEKRQKLKTASEEAIALVMQNNANGSSEERIGIDVFESNGNLVVEVLNRGVPIFINPAAAEHSDRIAIQEAFHALEKVSFENLGRQGQSVILEMRLGPVLLEEAQWNSETLTAETAINPDDIVIRRLEPGEEMALSQLFYSVYGYNYINDFVYYPNKMKAMIDAGKLISIVGSTKAGRILGHVGLTRLKDSPPVYEACLGVVDPTVKSSGLFGRIFQETMKQVHETPMQYCFFDFVTNHDFTQRFVARFGTCDLALFVGCQNKTLQAKLEKLGMGHDPKDMDRYSLLVSCLPRVEHPFGETIHLPDNLGDLLGFLIKPLNLKWLPSSRFEILRPHGEYQTQIQPSQNAVLFDLHRPGRKAIDAILDEWRQLLKNGYQYAAVEVPLREYGVGTLYDILSDAGFFVAGFVPYRHSNELGFRFQSIGPTKVAFDEIKVHTENAKKLLEIIRTNYERNSRL